MSQPAAAKGIWPDLSLLGVALIWGMNMPIMKYGITEVDPWLFNALRLTLSSIVLACCLAMEMRQRPGSLATLFRSSNRITNRKKWTIVGGFALFTGAFYQLAFLAGIDRTTAGNTAIIMSSLPMWTAFLAVGFLKERLTFLAWIGLTITFVGTLVVTFAERQVETSSEYLLGNLILLGAALAWAVGTVVSRPIMKYVTPIQLAFIALATTLPFHFLMVGDGFRDLSRFLEWRNLGSLIYSGAFSTGLAYAMWNYGVQKLGAAYSAVYQNLVPVVALIASWLLIAEIPSVAEIAGGAVIICGLLVVRKTRLEQP